jgi:hypothetical protein
VGSTHGRTVGQAPREGGVEVVPQAIENGFRGFLWEFAHRGLSEVSVSFEKGPPGCPVLGLSAFHANIRKPLCMLQPKETFRA